MAKGDSSPDGRISPDARTFSGPAPDGTQDSNGPSWKTWVPQPAGQSGFTTWTPYPAQEPDAPVPDIRQTPTVSSSAEDEMGNAKISIGPFTFKIQAKDGARNTQAKKSRSPAMLGVWENPRKTDYAALKASSLASYSITKTVEHLWHSLANWITSS